MADLLLHGGHALLVSAAGMQLRSINNTEREHAVEFSGETEASLTWMGTVTFNMVFDGVCIPFGRIKDIKLDSGAYASGGFPINPFKNVRTFRTSGWYDLEGRTRDLRLRMLIQQPRISSNEPRELYCSFHRPPMPHMTPIIHLAREGGRLGHQIKS